MSFRNPVRLLWVFGLLTEFVFRAYLVLVTLAWRLWWARARDQEHVNSLIYREMAKWRANEWTCRRGGRHQTAQFWALMVHAFQLMLQSESEGA